MPGPLRRWVRLDHMLQEISPGTFEVRDRGGRLIGWISSHGPRFQARGISPALADAPTLGTFQSGVAALRLVIGYYDVMQLRKTVIAEARRLEQEHERGLTRSARSTPVPSPGPRTAAPDRTPPALRSSLPLPSQR